MVKLANTETAAQKKATRAAYGAARGARHRGRAVVAVDADLTGSTTTKKLADAGYAGRLFNCGIAEQNMIDVAAGLAGRQHRVHGLPSPCSGTGRALRPDSQHRVLLEPEREDRPPPMRASPWAPDGGSHQMLEDVSLMRGLPGMRVLVPADYAAARVACASLPPRRAPSTCAWAAPPCPASTTTRVELEVGRAYVLREGSDVTIVANGVEIREALAAADALAADGISAEVIDAFR